MKKFKKKHKLKPLGLYIHTGILTNKGITLIALIVTIIVLLILAGISISMLAGNNGILEKAVEAGELTKDAEELENVKMAVMTALTDGLGNLTTSNLQTAIDETLGYGTLTGEGPWEYIGNRDTYQIETTGKITVAEEKEPTPGGLYDENDKMVASWDELVETYNFNIENDYTYSTYNVNNDSGNSMSYILNQYDELSSATKIVIPDIITEIGDYVFYKCKQIINYEIPDSVTSIGKNALASTLITEIKLPKNLNFLGATCFSFCQNLTSIVLPETLQVISSQTFTECRKLKSVEMGTQIKTIEESVFQNCVLLDNIILPNSIESIGKRAFQGCQALTKIDLPANLTSIEEATFSSCYNLETITMGNKIKTIGKVAFGSSGIKNINLPDSLETIGELAFNRMSTN